MRREIYKTNLAENIQLREKDCFDIYSLLFEKKKTGQKKQITFKRKFYHQKHKKLFSDQVSEKCEHVLSSVYNQINHMKSNSSIFFFTAGTMATASFVPSAPSIKSFCISITSKTFCMVYITFPFSK